MASDPEPAQLLRYDGTTSDHIRLVADDGTHYLVEVTRDLRGAVRRLGALASKLAEELDAELRPRDIQALIRSGIGPEELAQAAGIDPELVWRYAGPVVDERAWIAGRAQEVAVSHEDDAPLLGELALDRLATRGVSPDSMTWDALRDHGRWIVTLAYSSGEGDAEARWAVDLATGGLEALDEEAAWISETVIPDGPVLFDAGRAALSAITGGADPADGGLDTAVAQAEDDRGDGRGPSLTLLDDLMNSRGLRQPLDLPDDFDDEPGRGPSHYPDGAIAGGRSRDQDRESGPGPGSGIGPGSTSSGFDGPRSDGEPAPVADILKLLPPLETQETHAPLYSKLADAKAETPPEVPPAGAGSEIPGSGEPPVPSRRSILDRRQQVESDESKATRPPASPLEDDAPVGVEPTELEAAAGAETGAKGTDGEENHPGGPDLAPPASTVPSEAQDEPKAEEATHRARRRPTRRSIRDDDARASENGTPATVGEAPAALFDAAPNSTGTAPPAGSSREGEQPPKAPSRRSSKAPIEAASPISTAAPTEVVSLLPLDDVDPPAPPAGKPKGSQEVKARPRSRRSSVPSWDEIVFGAKPER